ncbi:hypothetical protein LI154_06120 [[Clostridium] scindens]|uniref:hypothetical protein n=1 Tax=Clostridium scindens (strain JCM 10418 / VPI 12708) TaxID=29347 RepID=UPI00040ADBC3|nr:hypothetical protein [[Clostridium] scindens]MCQ4688069.1 hypothetical protein [Clostridium sp. SL.3.18]MCB6423159.1 hypothetical protein [[Clostridium] scindens]MCB6644809.1 hypothetical protein [[Clostridium] scindens]MCB7194852.1 hypothetical protein [[Clostridium] scindens]MCB7288046.1 hypothetical protein [[Clostridium] scindens]
MVILSEIKLPYRILAAFSATKTIGLLDGIHPAASAGLWQAITHLHYREKLQ